MNLRLIACSIILSVALVSPAAAACFGTGSLQTCYDESGNSYSVSRFGNNTIVNGHNSRTGSSWSQQSSTFGNTTYHSGQTNGQSWNATDQRLGNMRMIYGTDSNGNHFNYSCDAFGNCY